MRITVWPADNPGKATSIWLVLQGAVDESMFVMIGIVIVIASVLLGYIMHHGNIAVLIQINEFVILGGAGIGSFLAGNGMKVTQSTIKAVLGLLKPDPYTKPAYLDLLKMMYQFFNVARK